MTAAWIVAGVSGLFVLAGVILVWRDMRRRRPSTALQPRPPGVPLATGRPPADAPLARPMPSPVTAPMPAPPAPVATAVTAPPGGADADVTIVHRTRAAVAGLTRRKTEAADVDAASSGSAFDALVSAVRAIRAEADGETADDEPEGQRWPSITGRWRALEAMVEGGVERLNSALNPNGLVISSAGDPSWSFRNRGYGTYRRVLLGGKSIAWLRTELTQTGQLVAKVRAHQVEQALVNAQASLPADGVTPNAVVETLAIALRPVAEFAAWSVPRRPSPETAGTQAWSSIDELTREAVAAAGDAFKVSGVRVVAAAAPAWDEVTGRQRWQLTLEHGSQAIGTVEMALAATSLDVTVVATDRLRNSLDRRRRLELAGLTAKSLSDTLAACAWPLIADAQNRADASKLGYAG
jgi:hypothetical protein